MISDRTLLILDLDETLIYGTEGPLDHPGDFVVEPYTIYKRPFLEPFLRNCAAMFDLAIWSSASTSYVEAVARKILPPNIRLVMLWSERRCTRHLDAETREEILLKDLKKIKRQGFSLEHVLILEDEPRKVKRHYGNVIVVPAYRGSTADTVLVLLGHYLETFLHVPDVRVIEKRDWISQFRPRRSLES